MPELTYNRVEIGEPLGPVDYKIDEERAREHHQRTEVDAAAFVGEDSEYVEPSILSYLAMSTLGDTYTGGGQIHTNLSYEFEAPLHVGDTLTGKGEISDKFTKRDHEYVEYDVKFTNQDEKKVGRVVIETVVGMDQ